MTQSPLQTVRQFLGRPSATHKTACVQKNAQTLSLEADAVIDLLQRRGRSWGLLASYEEKRFGMK